MGCLGQVADVVSHLSGISSQYADGPAAGLEEAKDDPQHCGLPSAVGTDQAQYLSFGDVEPHIFERGSVVIAGSHS